MGISTFSQLRTSMMNDLNRFGELEHIANTLQEICDFNGISELARLQDENAHQLGETMKSVLANNGLNNLLSDVTGLREEEFQTLGNKIAATIAGICKLDGISEWEKIQQESATHLGELMQSMMSNDSLNTVLADANRFEEVFQTLGNKIADTIAGICNSGGISELAKVHHESTSHLAEMMQSLVDTSRLSEAALCNFRDELTFLSETSNYFNRELLNEFSRHESLVEVVCAGGAISDQGLLDWLTQTRNKYFEEKSEAVNEIENVGKLSPELENDLVNLLCIFLIFSVGAITLHNKGMTLEAKDLFILALSLLPTIHRLIRSTKH